eukprot:maker-scaffold_32-snap-gene-1.34-mRNA-1 protein AED:0.00 eAED:0.00 QI:107/1/1/1/1/1/4/58/255
MNTNKFDLNVSVQHLTFDLNQNEPTTVIKLQNSVDKTYAFKIKTTEPKKYLVRPNQEVLRPEQHLEVKISMLPNEAKVMKETLEEDPEKLGKYGDKFLIQCLTLNEEELKKLEDKKNDEEKLTDLILPKWKETSEAKIGSLRLVCKFILPKKKELSKEDLELKDMMEMRKKYNDLLSFTVTLTSEKDRLKASYEEAAKELTAKRRNSSQIYGSGNFQNNGFSLIQVILIAVVAFFGGYIAQSKDEWAEWLKSFVA